MKPLFFCWFSFSIGMLAPLQAQPTFAQSHVGDGKKTDSLIQQWHEQPDTSLLETSQGESAPKESVDAVRAETFDDPFAGKYFVVPSAIPLKKGEAYYQNVLLGVNAIHYGISDHLSVTAGLEAFTLLYTLFGNDSRILTGFASVNGSTQIGEKWWVGGSLMGGALDEYEQLGILYGNATYGGRENHLSLGLGISAAKDRFLRQPMLTLSWIKQISPRWSLISENWAQGIRWVYDNHPQTVDRELHLFLSGGTRYTKGRAAAELGLVAYGVLGDGRVRETGEVLNSFGDWLAIPLPYASLVVKL